MAERSSKSGKKVVKAEAPAVDSATRAETRAEADRRVREGEGWKATPEAKKSASTRRVIAVILWVVAIALEGVGIWYLLTQNVQTDWFMWALIGLLVVIGILTVIGSQLWKKANSLDPASRQEPVRFFVQNQLGAIIPVIAFLPIIILIFLNKDVDAKTKGIAGGVGIALLVVAALLGVDFSPESQEGNTEVEMANEGQIDEFTAIVTEITGGDEVYWTPQGSVYHLCENVDDLQRESQDAENNVIRSGSVAAAHGDGKVGLTKEVTEEIEACAFELPANIDEIETEVDNLRDNPEAGS